MSGGRATGPDSSHTGRTTTGSSLPPAPWGRRQPGAAGQPRPASRGEERRPCVRETGDRAGHRPHQQPPPRAHPSTLLGSLSPHRAGPRAAQPRGRGGSCYSVPNPPGAQPYTSTSAPPPRPSVHFRKSRTLRPPPHTGALSSLGHGLRGTGDGRPLGTWPVTCSAEGPGFSPFSPAGGFSVEAPRQDGLGSWSFCLASLVLFMFLFTNWSGVLQGGRAAVLLSPRVSPGEIGSSPSAELDSTFPVTPPRTAL